MGEKPLLILVKHSLPEVDPALPARDWHLSGEGRARCAWLAREVRRLKPNALFSSLEPKALQTAELLAAELGLVSEPVSGLHENDRTGFPFILDRADFEARIGAFFDQPGRRLIGQESADEAFARFDAALAGVVTRQRGRSLCVVAHGTVISLFASRFNEVPALTLWKGLNPLPAFLTLALPDFELAGAPRAFRD